MAKRSSSKNDKKLQRKHKSAAVPSAQLLDRHRKAMEYAEKEIGKPLFQQAQGHFWGVVETRPYMSAKLEYARSLSRLNRFDEAIVQYQEMLALNPNDNQGIRYALMTALLNVDRNDAAEMLLNDYPDEGSAEWSYAAALLSFRGQGDTPTSRRLLRDAAKANTHVPDMLTGAMPIPESTPNFVCFGDQTEADAYVLENLRCWRAT